MHDHIAFLLTALLILLFGLFSKVTERLPVTAPMVFVAVGMLVSPIGLGLFDVQVNSELIKVIAELTLILVLFTDGTELKLSELIKQGARVPLRLLSIGLPLTMLLGIGVGVLLFDQLGIWQIALIALILSPTDAALGQAVIKSDKLPVSLKRWISVESGLNDGIALPPVLVCFAALAADTASKHGDQSWLYFLFLQLSLGPLIGALVGWIGGRLIEHASARDWMSPVFQRMSAMSLAVLCFALAEMVQGNGFIAAFIGGTVLGVQTESVRERIQEFGEAEGQQLSLFIFLILGMVGVPILYPYWDMSAVIYALLSLTLIRMLPVALSLRGISLDWATCLFIGWFGPRGIASVLYLLMAIGTLGTTGHEYTFAVIVLTVLSSVVLHGVTAVPFVNRYHSRPKVPID